MKLEVDGLRSGYRSGVEVLHGTSFTTQGGSIGFIGRNGAGKTCLAKTLSGALPASGGSVTLDGRVITKRSSGWRVRHGISLVPEGRLVFGQLTVRENLVVAAHAAKRSLAGIAQLEERFPILGTKRDERAASMSGGEQQLLAIGRALIQEPQLIILDEPSLGLSPIAVDNLTAALQNVAHDSDVSMILMEQNGEMLTGLCDQVMLIEQGDIVRELDMSLAADQQALEASYLGI
jgi:ABC-type branched-subunit amino acid transport system ATPase component